MEKTTINEIEVNGVGYVKKDSVEAKKPETLIDSADSWALIEMAAHYYDLKLSDGCSDWFLAAIKR